MINRIANTFALAYCKCNNSFLKEYNIEGKVKLNQDRKQP